MRGTVVPARRPAEVFEAERPRLLGLAYRLLGSMVDAEDVVQEAWFRFDRTDLATIDRPEAWLTTVVSRLGLDRLRARQRDRADYVGPWLPEPVLDRPPDPAEQAALADSLTTAFLLLLERLSPAERLALLLADVFGEPFSQVAAVLDKSEAATRQLASRARRKLREASSDTPSVPTPPPAEQHAVAVRLVEALARGDMAGAASLLAPDVVLLSDGGALVHAARRPVVGPERVARLMVNLAKRMQEADTVELAVLNHRPALVVRHRGRPRVVMIADVVDGAVLHVHIVNNPAKLGFVDAPVDLR